MGMIVMLFAVLSGIYGLMWLVFTFTEPPPSLSRYFQGPQVFYFLPERGARFAMAVIFLGVIPFAARMIVEIFTTRH